MPTSSNSSSARTKEIRIDKADLGSVDSLRYRVLSEVAREDYEKAIENLKKYVDSPNQLPKFRERAIRYADHGVDLIRAIRAKRHFPGFNSLSKSKQEELVDVVGNHFAELTNMLKRIESSDLELRLDDLRSTVWVLKAIVASVVVIIAVIFIQELTVGGIINSFYTVADTGFGSLLSLIGLR